MVRAKIEIYCYLWKQRFFRTNPEKLTKISYDGVPFNYKVAG